MLDLVLDFSLLSSIRCFYSISIMSFKSFFKLINLSVSTKPLIFPSKKVFMYVTIYFYFWFISASSNGILSAGNSLLITL